MPIEDFTAKLFAEYGPTIDNLQEGVVFTTPTGRIIGGNRAFQEIMSLPPK